MVAACLEMMLPMNVEQHSLTSDGSRHADPNEIRRKSNVDSDFTFDAPRCVVGVTDRTLIGSQIGTYRKPQKGDAVMDKGSPNNNDHIHSDGNSETSSDTLILNTTSEEIAKEKAPSLTHILEDYPTRRPILMIKVSYMRQTKRLKKKKHRSPSLTKIPPRSNRLVAAYVPDPLSKLMQPTKSFLHKLRPTAKSHKLQAEQPVHAVESSSPIAPAKLLSRDYQLPATKNKRPAFLRTVMEFVQYFGNA